MISRMSQMPSEPTRIPQWTLGWRLRRSLEEAGVSVNQMAAELGYERKTLGRWMHDQGSPPRPVVLKQWALRTGVSRTWLETGHATEGPGDGPGIASEGYDYGESATAIELMQYRSRAA